MKDKQEGENVTNWAGFLRNILNKTGFGNILIEQNAISSKIFLLKCRLRQRDVFLKINRETTNNLSDHL